MQRIMSCVDVNTSYIPAMRLVRCKVCRQVVALETLHISNVASGSNHRGCALLMGI